MDIEIMGTESMTIQWAVGVVKRGRVSILDGARFDTKAEARAYIRDNQPRFKGYTVIWVGSF